MEIKSAVAQGVLRIALLPKNIVAAQIPTNKAEALCREFSDAVEFTHRRRGLLKCRLFTTYLTPLIERLTEIGYCCPQVRRNPDRETCTAYFEPQSRDIDE
jgi:hypothetical protein